MRCTVLAVVSVLFVSPAIASAQTRINVGAARDPRIEIGGSLGAGWWFGGNDLSAIRVAVNHLGGLATEIALARERPNEYRANVPNVRLVLAGVRLMAPPNHRRSRPFLGASVAVGEGLPRAISPVLSAGTQTNWLARAALRIEVQRFLMAKDQEQKSRIMVGVSVGLGTRR